MATQADDRPGGGATRDARRSTRRVSMSYRRFDPIRHLDSQTEQRTHCGTDESMRGRMRRSLYVAGIIAGLGAIVEAQGPIDWTQWRGPARDGVIASFTPPPTWPDALVKRWNVE